MVKTVKVGARMQCASCNILRGFGLDPTTVEAAERF